MSNAYPAEVPLVEKIIDTEGLNGIVSVAEACYKYMLAIGSEYLFSKDTYLPDVIEFDALNHDILSMIDEASMRMLEKDEITYAVPVTRNLIKLQLAIKLFSDKRIPDGVKSQFVNTHICNPSRLDYWINSLPCSIKELNNNSAYEIKTEVLIIILNGLNELLSDVATPEHVIFWAGQQRADFVKALESLSREHKDSFILNPSMVFE